MQDDTTKILISKVDMTDGCSEVKGAKLYILNENQEVMESWTSGDQPHSEKEKKLKLGARIRKIRMFRNITQKELGRRLGYGENSADVRIAQYESGQRTPKQETLIRIAEILEVDVRNFLSPGIATMDELMETLFWMDEENRGLFHLFLLNDSESETVGITMRDKKAMSYLQEWMGKKQKLGNGRITEEEYLEWKLHWPENKQKKNIKPYEVKRNCFACLFG